METLEIGSFQVSIGSSDLRADEKFQVSWWVKYDDWLELNEMPNDTGVSDIAIIKLSRSVDNPRIVPAILLPLNRFSLTGLSLNVAGWGIEEGVTPRFLRTARVNVISAWQCSAILSRIEHRDIGIAPNYYMCTQGNPPVFITCGDSGSPLFTDDHQIVAINKAECLDSLNDEDRVNIHLVIDNYRHFITNVIGFRKPSKYQRLKLIINGYLLK